MSKRLIETKRIGNSFGIIRLEQNKICMIFKIFNSNRVAMLLQHPFNSNLAHKIDYYLKHKNINKNEMKYRYE